MNLATIIASSSHHVALYQIIYQMGKYYKFRLEGTVATTFTYLATVSKG